MEQIPLSLPLLLLVFHSVFVFAVVVSGVVAAAVGALGVLEFVVG